jgi:MFS family permease
MTRNEEHGRSTRDSSTLDLQTSNSVEKDIEKGDITASNPENDEDFLTTDDTDLRITCSFEPVHTNPNHSTPLGPSLSAAESTDLARTTSSVSIAEQLSFPHEILFVGVICSAQFCTQVGLGQCLSIIHQIGAHFQLSNSGELSWLIAGYSLTAGTFILVSGRLGDIFGYKRLLLIGFAWFALWSLVAGLSWYSNYVLFIFARVLSGIGPAIMLPNSLAILGATYAPGPRKSMVFAIFGATAPGGSIVGALFAGIFNLVWWPWTFFSFAITLAILAVLGMLVIPDPPRKSALLRSHDVSARKILWAMDPLGATTGVTALVLFNFAWNQAPIVGWQHPYVYVLLIVGCLFFGAFFYIELNVSSAPLIPFDALNLDVYFVLACIACGWASFGIWVFYIWQLIEVLRGAGPLLATAYLSPVAVSGACAAIMTGFLLERLRPAWVMLLALTFFTTGTILIMTVPVHQAYWAQIFVCTIVIPFGMDSKH